MSKVAVSYTTMDRVSIRAKYIRILNKIKMWQDFPSKLSPSHSSRIEFAQVMTDIYDQVAELEADFFEKNAEHIGFKAVRVDDLIGRINEARDSAKLMASEAPTLHQQEYYTGQIMAWNTVLYWLSNEEIVK